MCVCIWVAAKKTRKSHARTSPRTLMQQHSHLAASDFVAARARPCLGGCDWWEDVARERCTRSAVAEEENLGPIQSEPRAHSHNSLLVMLHPRPIWDLPAMNRGHRVKEKREDIQGR